MVLSKQSDGIRFVTKENALALECEEKENANYAANVDEESDYKENSSALDNNKKAKQATYPLLKKKVPGKKETCKSTQKAMTIADKCFNGKTVSANSRVKYTKPKLTNPKPFRLRTDFLGKNSTHGIKHGEETTLFPKKNKLETALSKQEETTRVTKT